MSVIVHYLHEIFVSVLFFVLVCICTDDSHPNKRSVCTRCKCTAKQISQIGTSVMRLFALGLSSMLRSRCV